MITLNVILGASVVMYFVGRNYHLWWINWPGTVVHELMHAAVGFVLVASPGRVSVFPDPVVPGQPKVIGGATFHNLNWFNTIPTAIAPLVSIPLILMNLHYFQVKETWKAALVVWLLSSVVSQALPSPVDWKIAFKNTAGVIFWIAVIGLLVYYNHGVNYKAVLSYFKF